MDKPLLKAYLDAIGGSGRALYVSCAGQVSRIGFEPPDRRFEAFATFFFARAAHCQLVELRVSKDLIAACLMRPHNWVDMPPVELAELIRSTSAQLGAKWQTTEQIEADAKKVVAEVVAKVEQMRKSGDLMVINAKYKNYRMQKTARGEKATSYTGYLNKYKKLLVAEAARKLSGG